MKHADGYLHEVERIHHQKNLKSNIIKMSLWYFIVQNMLSDVIITHLRTHTVNADLMKTCP